MRRQQARHRSTRERRHVDGLARTLRSMRRSIAPATACCVYPPQDFEHAASALLFHLLTRPPAGRSARAWWRLVVAATWRGHVGPIGAGRPFAAPARSGSAGFGAAADVVVRSAGRLPLGNLVLGRSCGRVPVTDTVARLMQAGRCFASLADLCPRGSGRFGAVSRASPGNLVPLPCLCRRSGRQEGV